MSEAPALVPEDRLPPGGLEQALGRLVAAGITEPADLAAALGLHAAHLGRPLRQLARAGLLDRQPGGTLQLTPAGHTRLRIPPEQPIAAEALVGAPEPSPAAGLPAALPLRPAPATPSSAPSPHQPVWLPEPAWLLWPARLLRAALPLRAERLLRAALPLRGARRHWPPEQLRRYWPAWRLRLGAVGGIGRSAPTIRRLTAVAASAVVVITAARLAQPAWPLVGAAAPAAMRTTPASDAARSATAAAEPASAAVPAAPTAPPVATSAPEQWVVVSHTGGLGLVLRPAPASNARILTLAEGARLRVIGAPVQQAGRAWLPVASQSGKTGWVAGEFVAPS